MANVVSADRFRSIAGSLPTGVSVVSTVDRNGAPVGMTSGAVCGLSRTPPLLLACIDKRSRTLAAILGHGMFCVNVLDAHSAWLSDRFASPVADRFSGVPWTPGPGRVPVLTENTVAFAVCERYGVLAGGDHLIVLGLIVAGDHDPLAEPLLYHRKRYAGLSGAGLAAQAGQVGDDQRAGL